MIKIVTEPPDFLFEAYFIYGLEYILKCSFLLYILLQVLDSSNDFKLCLVFGYDIPFIVFKNLQL